MTRNETMNADNPVKELKPKPAAPLFESTWVALFLVLKQEWLQYRNQE
jgi:hypothetical protein